MSTTDTPVTTGGPSAGIDPSALVARLRATFRSGRTRSADWRRNQLQQLARLLDDHERELIDALHTDLRRPEVEAYAADIGHAKQELAHTLRHLESWMQPERKRLPLVLQPGSGSVVPEPLGVTLVIAPWNYPIQLLLEPMAAAIAAGNCVVGKPSELAPACSALLARLVPQYLDPEAVVIVEGAVPETNALLEQTWDHIFFTGSTTVGRIVMQAAARNLTPVTLELGGKSPTYVAADADLEVAARRIAWGKFLNAGQTCIAPDYVLADRSIRDAFVDKLVKAIHDFYGADPRQSADLGRIVNERHVSRLTGYLAGEGAGTIVTGGQVEPAERYVAPTVVIDPAPDSALMTEEIFGPILPVLAVDGIDDAIRFIVDRPKPLALYVFSRSDDTVSRLLAETSSGGVCVNQVLMHILPAELPFGGVGPSGMGAYHGKTGFDAFSHHKSILRKGFRPDPPLMYPPYKGWKLKLIRRAL